MASWAERFAEYAEGKVPLVLVPVRLVDGVAVETGGASIPFVHDGEVEGAEPTESGWLKMGKLSVRTRTELDVGALYAYRGAAWQVAPHDADGVTNERDVMAGVGWHYGAKLVRHA